MIKSLESNAAFLEFAKKLLVETAVILHYKSGVPIVRSVSFFHIARARSLLRSIVILYEKGQQPDVAILLRALIEVYIRLAWILLDKPEEKARRYADMATVIRVRSVLKSKPDIPSFLKTAGDKFEKRYRKAVVIATKYKYKDILEVKKWVPNSIREMASETGCDYEYETLYDYYSESGHIGPAADIYYRILPNGGLLPRQTEHTFLLIWAIDLTIKTWSIGCKGMNGPFSNAVYARLEFDKIYKQILEKG